MKFRERGKGKPTVELKDREALVAYLRKQFRPWPTLDDLDLSKLVSDRYGTMVFDDAGFEECWLIIAPSYGAVGYANEPLR